MMKNCSVCKQQKELSEFGVLLQSKDGHVCRCKPCARKAVAASKAKNGRGKVDPVKEKERAKKFYANHPTYFKDSYWKNREFSLAQSKKYREKNKSAYNGKQIAKYRQKVAKRKAEFVGPIIPPKMLRLVKTKLWKIANPHIKAISVARRRANKKTANVVWANRFFMREIYHLAKLRSEATGIKWEVDHIVPLQSPVVCGLHVENNLQVIPAFVNRYKGNKLMEAYCG
jgi:hypothetical protein